MIDFKLAQETFKNFLQDFDEKQEKIKLKIIHTYHVVDVAEHIAKDLNLSEEDINLAKLIALLHDIGRFEQAAKYNDFRDSKTVDHASLGVEILFERNKIRDFIKDAQYDNIIYKAIANHNKLAIEDGLTEKELLHAKIIRDADKTDIFRVCQDEDTQSFLYLWNKDEIENGTITEKIFQDFMNNKVIVNSQRITPIDFWISHLALIFDFNYVTGLKLIMENNLINKHIDKINYKNPETKEKMELIRSHSLNYVNARINK